MALSILTHHMTGLSLGLALVGWFLYHAASGTYPRRSVVKLSVLFGAVAFLVVLPWGIPFVAHVLDVGFRREVPGLWALSISSYSRNIIDTGLIGGFVYPSYLGITLMVLAIGGTIYALIEWRRLAGLAIGLLVLMWFSMGADVNPIIRVYPFSGLDAAQFHLYMVPFMAILGAALVERIYTHVRDMWPTLSQRLSEVLARRLWYAVSTAGLVAVLAFPVADAWEARSHMEPYNVDSSVKAAIQWLADAPYDNETSGGRVYAIGLWNWHTFLVPYLADKPLVDGWHDEGARNVEEVRQLRMMGWTGNVDIAGAHQILSNLGGEYVLVNRTSDYPLDSSNKFWDGFKADAGFEIMDQWGDVAVFRVLE